MMIIIREWILVGTDRNFHCKEKINKIFAVRLTFNIHYTCFQTRNCKTKKSPEQIVVYPYATGENNAHANIRAIGYNS